MSTSTAMTISVAAREQLGQDFTLRSTWIGRLYDVHRAETARLRSCLHSCIRVAEFKYGLFVQCGGVHGGYGWRVHAGCLYGFGLVLHDGESAVGAEIRQLEVLVERLHGQVAFQSSARRFHGGRLFVLVSLTKKI